MWKLLAILNILSLLALGGHDLISRLAFSHTTEANTCNCCASCKDCQEEEEPSSCSARCDCGCFHISAICELSMVLPGNEVQQYSYPDQENSYEFQYFFPLLHPPIPA